MPRDCQARPPEGRLWFALHNARLSCPASHRYRVGAGEDLRNGLDWLSARAPTARDRTVCCPDAALGCTTCLFPPNAGGTPP